MTPRELLRATLSEWKPQFERLGFTLYDRLGSRREIEPGLVAHVWLNPALHRPDRVLEINQTVGVRHVALEDLVDDIAGPARAFPPTGSTVSTHLGYLTPRRAYCPVLIRSRAEIGPAWREFERDLLTWGLSFVRGCSDLKNLADALLAHGIRQLYMYQLPVLMCVIGDTAQARRLLREFEAQTVRDAAATRSAYMEFATRLRARLDRSDRGSLVLMSSRQAPRAKG